MRPIWRMLAAAALVSPLVAIACSGDDTPNTAPGVDAAALTFGVSECGACVATACGAARASCGAESECAVWLTCVEACGLGADGNVEPTCADECDDPAGSAARTAQREFTACRLDGAGTTCAKCGAADAGGALDPLLTQTCGDSTETNPCFICEDERCCNSYTACDSDPECKAYATCMKDCTANSDLDPCYSQCDAAHPTATVLYARRLTCVQVRCLSECANSEDPCVKCVNSECANSLVACDTDPECARRGRCIGKCDGQNLCINECERAHPTPLWEPFAACSTGRCRDTCG